MTAPFRGSSSSYTRQRLRGSGFVRVTRDVYLLRDTELDLRRRCQAALVVFPEATICLETAARLLTLPVDHDGVVHLDRGPLAARSRRAGLKVHRFGIESDSILDLDGLPVSDGPRTFADLSDRLGLEGLVAVGDVVSRRWEPAQIAAAVEAHGRRPGAVRLRAAVPLLDKGADSPAETRARLRLHAAGFARLQHKVIVRDIGGGWLGEPDLADEVAKVALQHEGAVHFQKGERQRVKDVDRDEVVRQEGWQVVTSTARDDRQPERLIARVTAAYRRSAALHGRDVLPAHLR